MRTKEELHLNLWQKALEKKDVIKERALLDRKRVVPGQSRASGFQEEELVTVPNIAWGPGRVQGLEGPW